jgi:outer membrane protein
MKTWISLLLLLLLVFPNSAKAEDLLLTIEEAVIIALRDNRDVLLRAEEVKKAQARIEESQGMLWPSLTLGGSATRTFELYPKDFNTYSPQVSFKQYLYRGGKTMNTIAQNTARKEVSQALSDRSQLEILQKVRRTFYTLILGERFATLNRQIVDNTQKHLAVLEARVHSGQVAQEDLLSVKKSLEMVQQAATEAENQVSSLQALMGNILYLEESAMVRPRGELIYDPKDIAYDQGFIEAMKNRPEIRQYEAQLQADQKAMEIVKADNRPSVYASWDYYARSNAGAGVGLVTPVKAWNDYSVLGITFSWPIFDGWATKKRLDQAIVDFKTTQLNQEKAIKDIALELKNAYLALKNAVAQVKSAEADMAYYEATLKSVEEKYGKGIASSLDVDDFALSRQVSLFNKEQAVYNYIVARIDFDKATGGI